MGERTRELLILIGGDLASFFLALWLTLLVRYVALPDSDLIESHFGPFLILSGIWLVVFYIGGLYDKHTSFLKSLIFGRILNIQVANVIIAAIVFMVVPFGIAPKTNLIIYLIISVFLITVWRLYIFQYFSPKLQHKAILIADGPEAIELVDEINNNDRYNYTFVRLIDSEVARKTPDFEKKLIALIEKENIQIIVANPHGEYAETLLPVLFDLAFLNFKFTFLDFHQVYEDTFDRVPLSALRYDWFLSHVSQSKSPVYDFAKRAIDIVGCMVLGVFLVIVLPFVYIAERIEGKQSGFFMWQKRMGQFNKQVQVLKLQTMTINDAASSTWKHEDAKKGNVITRVGKVLQKTSLDEFPQIWNILKGDMSLIGPRNDIEGLGHRLIEQIPYYKIRYFVKPGVTGWAQTNQHYRGGAIQPQSLEESQLRLAYDLYYVKNRSLGLDIAIALKTIKTVLSRFGISIRWPG
jgi:lipopolysaccharide/colanic/teichoic acid biosynthesis glycosyltransferase